MDLIEDLARRVAGDDDAGFVVAFQSLVNVAEGLRARPREDGARLARSVMLRAAEPQIARRAGTRAAAVGAQPAAAPGDSIFTDPVFLANARRMVSDRERIVGGVETGDFPDCVAIGSAGSWCCSGTLVARNVVVTAGHCWAGGCAARVLVGQDVEREGDGQLIEVASAQAHPDYDPPAPLHDIAVLILARDVDVSPRAIGGAAQIAAAASARLAGFGNTDIWSSAGYGRRRMVDVPMASSDPRFGADPDTEFVAGAPFLDRDSCNGDSGGPAYVDAGGSWYLAGATSRATASAVRPCGDGGIYTRVHAYADWIRSVPGGHWD
jgi:secreted trypsin-like serine protease